MVELDYARNITLYTAPTCGHCQMVKELMHKKKILFNEVNDDEIVLEAARQFHTTELPFAIINGEFFNYQALQQYIKTL